MLEFLERISSHKLFNLVSLFFGFLMGYYFFFKSKKEKKPTFKLKTIPLIKNSVSAINDLEIKFGEEDISNLNVSKLAFWNSGSETIRKSDFVKEDLLRIEVKADYKIFGFDTQKNDMKNGVKIKKKKDRVLEISFDYLDRNQGFIINIYNNIEDTSSILLKGAFIGSNPLKVGFVKQRTATSFLELYLDPISDFFQKSKFLIFRIIGFLIVFPLALVAIVFALPLGLYDTINETFFDKLSKDFDLDS